MTEPMFLVLSDGRKFRGDGKKVAEYLKQICGSTNPDTWSKRGYKIVGDNYPLNKYATASSR